MKEGRRKDIKYSFLNTIGRKSGLDRLYITWKAFTATCNGNERNKEDKQRQTEWRRWIKQGEPNAYKGKRYLKKREAVSLPKNTNWIIIFQQIFEDPVELAVIYYLINLTDPYNRVGTSIVI